MSAVRLRGTARHLHRLFVTLAITLGSLMLAPYHPASAAASPFTFFPVPTCRAPFACTILGIATGSDHNLWFTQALDTIIERFTLSGVVTQHALPLPITSTATTAWITAGPDGNLWVSLPDLIGAHSLVARVNTHFGATLFAIPGATYAWGITVGPDGNLWLTDDAGGHIIRVTTAGAVTEFNAGPGSDPYQITSGPDGNLWFTDFNNRRIGRLTPSGHLTYFPLAVGLLNPDAITAGPDGALWFTLDGTNAAVGRITTTGAVTLVSVPQASTYTQMLGIIAGPDGKLYFTLRSTLNAIGRLTTAGVVSVIPLPAPPPPTGGFFAGPAGLTVGPDGAIWFVTHALIGRLAIS